MARKYVAFDIETSTIIDGPDFNWRPHRPIGISCAATLASDADEPIVWHGMEPGGAPAERMSREEACALVEHLVAMRADGYTVLTWNGLGFDFDVLAEESDALGTCKDLALDHVDMMFHVFCDRGFPVALDKAAQGLKIPGKPAGMSGELAPQLWTQGRYQEVLDYVSQDVRLALQIARECERTRSFKWKTQKGTTSSMPLRRGWLTVREAMQLPAPDTSWMSRPLSREHFAGWLTAE